MDMYLQLTSCCFWRKLFWCITEFNRCFCLQIGFIYIH